MENLLKKAFDPKQFRKDGYALIDLLADFLQNASEDPSEKVFKWQSPDQAYLNWENRLQNDMVGSSSQLFQQVLAEAIQLQNPNYMGHQISPPVPISALAGLVGDFLNNGMGIYEMGIPGTAIERVVIKVVAKVMGFAEDAEGILTSGGSLANLTALLSARSKKTQKNIWEEGKSGQLALMVSEEAHYCVDRAVRIMGWGKEGIIKVPVNEQYQMRTELLEEYYQKAKEEEKEVIAVVGSACSTSTGAFDNLEAIGAFCNKHQLWFHVDGAHGGSMAFSGKYRHLLKGVQQADSVVMDFHKVLMTPAISTALIFKNPEDSYQTFSQKAHYLWNKGETQEWFNLAKRTFECTKVMIGLKAYSIIQIYGLELFDEYVTKMVDLSKSFADTILQHPSFELALLPECNIVCFRFFDSNLSNDTLNELNNHLRQAVIEEGNFYLVKTTLKDKVWLRTTFANPFTKEVNFKTLLNQIEVHANLKSKDYQTVKPLNF